MSEYLKVLHARRAAMESVIAEAENKIDRIDEEIARNTEPPDVSKMTPLERSIYEDGLRMRQQIAKAMAEESPFINLMGAHTFPKL